MSGRPFPLTATLRLVALVGLVLSLAVPAHARNPNAVLHEQIPADPREDVALALSLDGDLPAAIDTPSGMVPAPDPRRAPDRPAPYAPDRAGPDKTRFEPDRDTHKPEALPYDEPFSPSTAPFKRLSAFDQVDASYTLSVRDSITRTMLAGKPTTTPLANEDLFYGDMIVDVRPDKPTRIPSVGAGSRILRARAGVGSTDVAITFARDGADNWFIFGDRETRARVVMEIAIPRAALGGDFGDPSWAELSYPVAPVPPNIARSALEVQRRIGVSTTTMRPREVVSKMAAYFRAFQDSPEGPAVTRDVYLDLALSQKGVCRHRAFAFLVTALSMGIPTRMVINEAHAWVEVYDGRMFRRIDLGGAGRMQRDETSQNVPYDNPDDPFAWPPGTTRGQDLQSPRRAQAALPPPAHPPSAAPSASSAVAFAPSSSGGFTIPGVTPPDPAGNRRNGGSKSNEPPPPPDMRAPTTVTLEVLDADTHRGSAFHVRGRLVSDGDACTDTAVVVVLISSNAVVPIGTIATDDKGAFDASITLQSTLAVGEYDVRAYTQGNTHCGPGVSP